MYMDITISVIANDTLADPITNNQIPIPTR